MAVRRNKAEDGQHNRNNSHRGHTIHLVVPKLKALSKTRYERQLKNPTNFSVIITM